LGLFFKGLFLEGIDLIDLIACGVEAIWANDALGAPKANKIIAKRRL